MHLLQPLWVIILLPGKGVEQQRNTSNVQDFETGEIYEVTEYVLNE